MTSLVSTGLEITDRALTVAFRFGKGEGFMDGLLLYVPDPGSLETIEDACRARRGISPVQSIECTSWSGIQSRGKKTSEPMCKNSGEAGIT